MDRHRPYNLVICVVCSILSVVFAAVAVGVWFGVSKERSDWNAQYSAVETSFANEHWTGYLTLAASEGDEETYQCGCLNDGDGGTYACLQCSDSGEREYFVWVRVSLFNEESWWYRCTAEQWGYSFCEDLEFGFSCSFSPDILGDMVIYYDSDNVTDYDCSSGDKTTHVEVVYFFSAAAGVAFLIGFGSFLGPLILIMLKRVRFKRTERNQRNHTTTDEVDEAADRETSSSDDASRSASLPEDSSE